MKYFHPKKWLRLTNEKIVDYWYNYFLPDKIFLRIQYRRIFGKKLNLKNPQTYNEKIQWLKIYDRNPLYPKLVDKFEVKNFIAKTIGEQYIIQTLGVWDKFEDINFETLPNQFVLKCTHDSASVVICTDKSNFDYNSAKKKLTSALKFNYYHFNRQWAYKDIKPRIIAEKFMVDESGSDLKDYKFFCFDGVFKYLFIASDRASHHTKFDFYDENFNLLPFTNGHPMSGLNRKKPENFDKMVQLAEKLSKNIPQVRVDFYSINGDIYFGEMTFYHWGGLMPFEPVEWDYKFGSWIKIPIKK